MAEKNFRTIRRRNSPPVVHMPEALADYYGSVNFKKLATSTKANYKHFLDVFAAWCEAHIMEHQAGEWRAVESDAGIFLSAVDSQVVYCFLEHVKTTHAPNPGRVGIAGWTLATYVKCIKLFLNWCVLDEQYTNQVQAVTVQRIQIPPTEQETVRTLSREQVKALFEACKKEESEHLQVRDVAILSLLLETGIRAEELTHACIGDLHLAPKDSYIHIPITNAKGGSAGEMPIGEDARRALRQYIELFRAPTVEFAFKRTRPNLPRRQYDQELKAAIAAAPLFVSRYGEPLTRDGLRQVIKRLGEWADIEGVRCTPHDFRHTFARMFMENGGDIYQLQKILRHRSIRTTENYLRSLQQSEVRKGAKSVLDNL